jgi:alpha-L-fucosidase
MTSSAADLSSTTAATATEDAPTTGRYEPTWESVSTHAVPTWFDDAKLGVILHWGLYSVPGWAPQVANIQDLLREEGPVGMLRSNPYAEWYRNTMQLDGSPTQRHHHEVYGDAPYDDFITAFDEGALGADLDGLAGACQDAGARYVVFTTKHHEGFTLWPSRQRHPVKGAYRAQRDVVGDLTAAVRGRGMKMGLYYSGGYDWPWNDAVIARAADTSLATPADPAYNAYATAHIRELIDRYAPSVLWNDVCWPAGGDLPALFAHYYNTVDDGVINDRWLQPTGSRNRVSDAVATGVGELIQATWQHLPEQWKSLTFPAAHHFDFNTPEYSSFDEIRDKKWESTRGVGHSFGANRNERPQDIVTTTELVRMLCDVVSKNGNLLIGAGPGPDGRIPDEQITPLRGLGEWMAVNGEAIYGTRPWVVPSTTTTEGTEVRFTRRADVATTVYALLIDTPGRRTFSLRDVDATGVTGVRLLGVDEPIEWTIAEGVLEITLPDRLPIAAAHAVELTGTPRSTA